MTDHEMLEHAAKAAGIAHVTPTMVKYGHWNPLTDDGDALRLAVELEMDFVWEFDRVEVYTDKNFVVEYFYDLPTPTDRHAATRRAITRAAAEIGRAIP